MAAPAQAKLAAAVCIVALWCVTSKACALCSEAADRDDAGVIILRCPDVVIAAEASAVRSPALLLSRHPRAIQLDDGLIAIAINSPAAPFSVLTPQAVVTGGEGDWAVLAESGQTRALVRRGTATARQRADGSEQILQPDAAGKKRMDRLFDALQRVLARP